MSPSTSIRSAVVIACAVALGACQGTTQRTGTVVVPSAKAGSDVRVARVVPASSPAAAPVRAAGNAVVQPALPPPPAVLARADAARVQAREFMLPGYNVYEAEGGRLWVFRSGSEDLGAFLSKGEPAKRVTQIGAGPGGRTLMGADAAVLTDYANSFRYRAAGYAVIADDGRLWVFEDGGEDHKSFLSKGEPAKRVTLIGEGPDGLTLLGADTDVMRAYAVGMKYVLPGYAVIGAKEGRLWVFRDGSADHKEFLEKGEPAKRVTLIAAGPEGRTLLGSDQDDMQDYADSWRYALPGFAVVATDGRLWVFRAGSEDHEEFVSKGEPAKRVTLIGRGPDGRTLMGSDTDVIEAYAEAARAN